jgi:hypothetical protein
MTGRNLWGLLPPVGPVLSIILVGLVLLSGLLYYRAVKIQRFIEPALAFSQPRNEYSKRIRGLFRKEFGDKTSKGLDYNMGVIHLRPALLFSPDGSFSPEGQTIMKKLGRIFITLMQDDQARSEISIVLISARIPLTGPLHATSARSHMIAGFVQDGLFRAEPELARRYSAFFATATQPLDLHEGNANMDVDIRIIPSEFLHIKMLEKLEKYSY